MAIPVDLFFIAVLFHLVVTHLLVFVVIRDTLEVEHNKSSVQEVNNTVGEIKQKILVSSSYFFLFSHVFTKYCKGLLSVGFKQIIYWH